MKLFIAFIFGLVVGATTLTFVSEDANKYIYIHIFDAMIPIPMRYSFDAQNITSGIRFLDENGSLVIGKLSEVSSESHNYLFSENNEDVPTCGLGKFSWIKDGIKSVTIKDGNSFVWFANIPQKDVDIAIAALCESRNA